MGGACSIVNSERLNHYKEKYSISLGIFKKPSEKSSDEEEDLENFVQLAIYHGNTLNSAMVFLQDEEAAHIFTTFLKKECLEYYYIHECLQNLINDLESNKELTKELLMELISRYAHKNREISGRVAVLYYGTDDDIPSDEREKLLKQVFCEAAREEMMQLMSKALPQFLSSQTYQQWRDQEAINGYSFVNLPLLKLIKSKPNDDEAIHEFVRESSFKGNSTQRAFAALDPREFQNIANSHYLSTFLGAIESLPICISLSSTTPHFKQSGFPIIYVNKIFEDTTGYNRDELVGQNCCSFLQKENNSNVTKIVTKSLNEAKLIKFKSTSYHRNGESFINLTAYKPLFNQQGVFSYIIGLHFDISSKQDVHGSISKCLADLDMLLKLLPDRLPMND